MKKLKVALISAICLIVVGVLGILTGIFTSGRYFQETQSQTQEVVKKPETASSQDPAQRPTEPNLQEVTEERITRIADSEDDLTLKGDKNSQKTNQIPDVTDGKVLRNSTFDFKAIQKGDYSSVAGTWQDGYGNIILIDKDGKITDTTQFRMTSLQHGILAGDYRDEDGYGAGAQFVPAGIDASVALVDSYTIYDASDVSQDRIWLGDTWASLADPYIFYYRVTEVTETAE